MKKLPDSPMPSEALLASSSARQDPRPRPALTFDAAEYAHFLADTDWTEEQKTEFTEALWQIVVGFVDLGFGLHPAQQVVGETLLELDSPSVIGLASTSTNNKADDTARTYLRAVQRMDS